jgi:hypothetical protein
LIKIIQDFFSFFIVVNFVHFVFVYYFSTSSKQTQNATKCTKFTTIENAKKIWIFGQPIANKHEMNKIHNERNFKRDFDYFLSKTSKVILYTVAIFLVISLLLWEATVYSAFITRTKICKTISVNLSKKKNRNGPP